MFGNNRKTIGIIIGDVASYFQETLCTTMSEYGNSLGYNLAFFSCFSVFGSNTENAYGEFNIISLPPYKNLDAIIVCPDTLFVKDSIMDNLRDKLKQYTNCPIICIRRPLDDHRAILVDDMDSFSKIVEHFIEVHHFCRIGMMTGPKKHPDSIARFNSYKKTLEKYNIPYDESLVFEGDFWKNRASLAADYYLNSLDSPPEAIVCANDYMALSLTNELVLRGCMVPDDIAISGYDNIRDAENNVPPLTTVSVPAAEMARKSIDMIDNILNGKEVPQYEYVETEIVRRNSCGCSVLDMCTMISRQAAHIAAYDQILRETHNNTFTSIALESLQSVFDIGYFLQVPNLENNNISNLFLCLGEGPGNNYPKYHSNKPVYPEECRSVYSIMNCEEISTDVFKTSSLIPKEAVSQDPVTYYFFPLHYLDYTLGYVAIMYASPTSVCGRVFQTWLTNISNSIENVRVSNESRRLLNELNNLYVHDALTGLYNRRGFEQMSSKIYSDSLNRGQKVMILGIDMDNLKLVNDRFGHLQGDLALKTIADALTYASHHSEICARVGGDEYNVIGADYSKKLAEEYIKDFQFYLDEFNNNSDLEYRVEASYGYVLVSKEDEYTLEECMNLSDNRLYEQKAEKKKNRNYSR